MRYNELAETFDKPYDYTWTDQSKGAWRGIADLNDGTVLKMNIEFWSANWAWLVEFSRESEDYSLSFRKTGQGDAFRVFSTVLKMLEEFIKTVNPESLYFGADKGEGESRTSLYKRMVKRFADKLGYDTEIIDRSFEEKFILTKKEI